jgi:hypothetical protein
MAKIETLGDNFADLDNWEPSIVVAGSASIVDSEFTSNIDSSSGVHYVIYQTVDTTYTFTDTWLSLGSWTYTASGQEDFYPVLLGVGDTFGNIVLGALIEYVDTTDEVHFCDASGTRRDTIDNPGTPLFLGIRTTTTDYYLHYSVDEGDTWTEFYTSTWDTSFGLPHHAIIGTILLDGTGPFSVSMDEFNLYEPPAGPITNLDIEVDLIDVTVTADPRVRLIIGDYIETDVDLIDVTVTALDPDEPLLGVSIDVDLIDVTTEAVPPTSIDFGPYYVTFLPATPFVTVVPPLSIDLGEEPPSMFVEPAEINITVTVPNPIVGTFYQGDLFTYPWEIIESGSETFDMTNMSDDFSALPSYSDVDHGDHYAKGWVRYYSQVPAQLTVTATSADPFIMIMAEGDTALELVVIGDSVVHGTSGTIVADINSGYTYIQLAAVPEDDSSITLTWSYIPVPASLMMDMLTPIIDMTPDAVMVSVQGGSPGEDIRFTWSPPVSDLITGTTSRPITLATVGSDFEGNILTATLEIPAVYAGTYEVTATGVSSGAQATTTFIVENDPLPQDSSPSSSEPVASISVKWLWDDGAGHEWIMQYNPDRMTTPVSRKVLTPERTTAGTGQHIIWQGARPAVQWSFNGTVMSQSEYEELEYFYDLNRRFYITDHRNRTFVVTMKSLNATPRKNGNNFWTFDYEVNCLLFEQVI